MAHSLVGFSMLVSKQGLTKSGELLGVKISISEKEKQTINTNTELVYKSTYPSLSNVLKQSSIFSREREVILNSFREDLSVLR